MNETLKTIHSLHSTHGNFSSREIAEADLEMVVKAAVRASNASARQSYSIIVVDDKTAMKEYLEYVGSRALIFCLDFTRLNDISEYLGYHPECLGNGDIMNFITASTDTALAVQTAAIAAASLGIDYLITNSVHRGDMKKFYEKFKLPQRLCFPIAALILGYADDGHVVRGRLDGPGVVHRNEYRRLDSEGLASVIGEYDRPEKNMGLAFNKSDSSQTYGRYMDWYYKKWSSDPDSGEKRLRNAGLNALLKSIGFIE